MFRTIYYVLPTECSSFDVDANLHRATVQVSIAKCGVRMTTQDLKKRR